MQREVRGLLKVAKRVVSRAMYQKLARITDEEEARAAAKYAITRALEHKYDVLRNAIARAEKKENTLFAEVKAARIPGKIQFFTVSYDMHACEQVLQLLEEGHKELHYGAI